VATLAANTTASGSSPFTWKIGASTILRDVGRIGRRAREARRGGEADLVVDDEVHRAAGAVALQARQAKHSATTPWPAKAASPCISSGITACASAMPSCRALVLLGARLAEHDGIDDFEMRRVGGQRQVHVVAVELAVDEAPR
jgi:hypothetical protein